MKVLFLDHDGVICLMPQWGKRKKFQTLFDPFCSKAVKVLNEIIKATDCNIVVSSDWRLHCDINKMKSVYTNRNILKEPIGFTPVFSDMDEDILETTWSYKDRYQIAARVREKEIRQWLEINPGVTSWVAVDDLSMHKLKCFVHTPYPSEGIKQTGVKEKIIKHLNGEDNESV
jgi:hypothetical protein